VVTLGTAALGLIEAVWLLTRLLWVAACLYGPPEQAAAEQNAGPLPYLTLVGGYSLLLLATANHLLTPIGGLIISAELLTLLLVVRHMSAMQESIRLVEERAAEEARARAAAESASEAKSAFLASMSHELRSPLTAILGYSELLQLQAEQRDMPGLRDDLRLIESSGHQLLSMVNNVLDLAKIESGALSVTAQRFDLAAFVGDLAIAAGPLAAERGNRLQVDCPPDIGAVELDPLRLRQLLMHLLHNAGKFTERGLIALRVEPHPADAIRITVADSGIGIDADLLGRLFQPFAQAHTGLDRQYDGSGLGLAISRRLCELMGGSIAVSSAPGQGSTFTVTLPRALPPR
jgi:signal transduction histidine kinase